MRLSPQSSAQIDKALSALRRGNYAAGVSLGVFVGLMLGIVLLPFLAIPDIFLAVPAVLGGWFAFLLTRRYWQNVLSRFCGSFIQFDDSVLEVRGPAWGGDRHIRCKLSDVDCIEVGDSMNISEKSGESVVFIMISKVYSAQDLRIFTSVLGEKLGRS